jgi:hypothetical protein
MQVEGSNPFAKHRPERGVRMVSTATGLDTICGLWLARVGFSVTFRKDDDFEVAGIPRGRPFSGVD